MRVQKWKQFIPLYGLYYIYTANPEPYWNNIKDNEWGSKNAFFAIALIQAFSVVTLLIFIQIIVLG